MNYFFLSAGLVLSLTLRAHSPAKQKPTVDTLRTQTLDPVSVEGRRMPSTESLPDVKGTYLLAGKRSEIISITGQDANITRKSARQLFARVPGLFVYDMDGTGNQLNISTRGLDSHRSWELNIRQNGVITNADMYGYPAGHYSAPMESRERVELVRSTASLQYGPQFGGMINYVTKHADSLVMQGMAVARYDKRVSGTNRTDALTKLTQPPRPDDYISDAVGFIRLLRADPRFRQVVVAGHDEGSFVGMLAARQAGADKFVSLAGAGRNLADLLRDRLMPATGPADVRQELPGLLDSLRAGQTVHPQSVQLKAQFAPREQPAYRAWMQLDPVDALKAFGGPVLIVQAGNDTQLSPVDTERLRTARPDAAFTLFGQMTHQLKNYAGSSLIGNRQTYNQPTLPVTPGFAAIIAQFVGL